MRVDKHAKLQIKQKCISVVLKKMPWPALNEKNKQRIECKCLVHVSLQTLKPRVLQIKQK